MKKKRENNAHTHTIFENRVTKSQSHKVYDSLDFVCLKKDLKNCPVREKNWSGRERERERGKYSTIYKHNIIGRRDF